MKEKRERERYLSMKVGETEASHDQGVEFAVWRQPDGIAVIC